MKALVLETGAAGVGGRTGASPLGRISLSPQGRYCLLAVEILADRR